MVCSCVLQIWYAFVDSFIVRMKSITIHPVWGTIMWMLNWTESHQPLTSFCWLGVPYCIVCSGLGRVRGVMCRLQDCEISAFCYCSCNGAVRLAPGSSHFHFTLSLSLELTMPHTVLVSCSVFMRTSVLSQRWLQPWTACVEQEKVSTTWIDSWECEECQVCVGGGGGREAN